jgi:hypothetical protein
MRPGEHAAAWRFNPAPYGARLARALRAFRIQFRAAGLKWSEVANALGHADEVMKLYVRKLLVVLVVLGLVGIGWAVLPFYLAWGAVRTIDMPPREAGYRSFGTQIIRSQHDLDALMKTAAAGKNWNNWSAFDKAIANANVDFSHQSLLLIRHTECAQAIMVRLGATSLWSQKLTCRIRTLVPKRCDCDETHYCFGLVVENEHVEEVEIWVNDKRLPDVLPLQKAG